MIKYVVAFIVFAVILGLAYVRLAPFDAARFHTEVFPAQAGDYETANSFTAIREITVKSEDLITALDRLIVETPRTRRMAGLPGTTLITYETRSALFGFPDYTNLSIILPGTVGNDGPLLAIRGRARFGASDIGVNKARILSWLDALGPLTVDP